MYSSGSSPQCYVNLMKRCWDENSSKRPNASEIKDIIKNWYGIIGDKNKKLNNEENDILVEFWKAEQKQLNTQINYKPIIESHPQAYYTSCLLDFTKQLNKILDQEDHEDIGIIDYEDHEDMRIISQNIGNYYNIYYKVYKKF